MRLLKVTSPAFRDGGRIPAKYACDGKNVSPPLNIESIPEETQTLVLIVDDPDAPRGTFTHWLVWNIPPANRIMENTPPGVEGMNSAGQRSYHGPCPPPGPAHRYVFKVYALDARLDIAPESVKQDVEMVMGGHILAVGQIMGLYEMDDAKSEK